MPHKNILCELSDEEVVKMAQKGNTEALDHMIVRYRNFVYSKSKRYFLVGQEQDDLVQEGMIGLYEAIKNFNSEKGVFKSFAGVCIKRQLISAVKTATRNKHIPLNSYISLDKSSYDENNELLDNTLVGGTSENPESIVIDKENLDGMETEISSRLSGLEKKVLMYYLDGYSYQQISEKISKDIKSVDNAVQRIKKKLTGLLSE